MEFLSRFHQDWAYTAIAINFVAAIWTLIGVRNISLQRKKYFYWPVYAAWLALVIQVFLGIALFSNGIEAKGGMQHYFYGFIFLIFIGGLFSYQKSLGKKKALVFGLVTLFFAAMAVRAIFAAL